MMRALYTGAMGMKTISTGMQTVSNNLANVNTVGYRQQQILYDDMRSQFANFGNSSSTSFSQVGAGVMPSDVRTIHKPGGYESSNSMTDMSINNGKGFFGVTQNGETHYTRAGNFNFNKNGELVDPSGWNVLGLPITNGVKGTNAVPVTLDVTGNGTATTMAPKATSKLGNLMNLGSTESKSNNAANPYFSMLSQWNGSSGVTRPNAMKNQEMMVYDTNGNQRSLDISYDHAKTENGISTFEFFVTCDPSLDAGPYTNQAGAGALMAGTLTFDNTGKIIGMSAYTPQGNPSNLANWLPAGIGADGSPAFNVTFPNGATQTIELDLGIKAPNGWATGGSAASVGTNAAALAQSVAPVVSKATTTAYSGSTDQNKVTQDGYTTGHLNNLTIGKDGTIVASYSNGQNQDLFQIPLFRFTSDDGLRREGSNHYSAGTDAGAVEMGEAGTENYGAIHGNSLETSNVDMATEFVNMITTQRAFQSNSKMVTTADALLQKALELKR